MNELLIQFNKAKRQVIQFLKEKFPDFFEQLTRVIKAARIKIEQLSGIVVNFFKDVVGNLKKGNASEAPILKEAEDFTTKPSKRFFSGAFKLLRAFFNKVSSLFGGLAERIVSLPVEAAIAVGVVAILALVNFALKGIFSTVKGALKNKESKNKLDDLLKNEKIMSFFLLVIVAPSLQEIVRYSFIKKFKNKSLVTFLLIVSDILKQKAIKYVINQSSDYKYDISSQSVVHVINHIIQVSFKGDPAGLLVATIVQSFYAAFNSSFITSNAWVNFKSSIKKQFNLKHKGV